MVLTEMNNNVYLIACHDIAIIESEPTLMIMAIVLEIIAKATTLKFITFFRI